MLLPWLWLAPLVALGAAGPGSSLRGAVEALQRRQRAQVRLAPPQYDALYEFIPPGYPEPDYTVDVDDMEEGPSPKLIVKLLEENEHPSENYEYKVIKKKSSNYESSTKKESAFRERSHHSDNDKLRDLFSDNNEVVQERKNEALQDRPDNDAEYALLLSQLWSKYKGKVQHNNLENIPQGVVKLYNEKLVQKRYPDSWGPIAFKRKRSSDADTDRHITPEYEMDTKTATSDSNYNTYDVSDNDKDDWREEYAIAFQPLDDDSMTDISGEQYSYDNIEKRFPVTKRSSNLYDFNNQKKRYAQNQKLKTKTFRSSAGTDPRIIKDLSRIFGDRSIKNPVKRNVDPEDSHEVKPPKLPVLSTNHTHDRNNSTHHDDVSHEHHGHNMQHPGISGKEADHLNEHFHGHDHDHNHAHASSKDQGNYEKPKIVRKKSIDWSDYFGIDKRTRNHLSDESQNRLRKQYFNTFNREVVYPTNTFRKHSYSKRNYVEPKKNTMTEVELNRLGDSGSENKRNTKDNDSKLDNIDKKLRNMEGMLVDDALRYSEVEEELDSKEEQEMKEKLLSRLAAAYSLEKMRKALKEFKQSLQTPRPQINNEQSTDEAKAKRVAVKKEKVDITSNEIPLFKEQDKNDDFEEEQGAGQYLNGRIEQQFSEGYMGGSGRHRSPIASIVGSGSCPVLSKIVQRCRGVDLLAGDRGQLFLPLCSLHQICYLCGEAPQTTCDLVFLSEADSTCEGDSGCQRAARSALMALRELHDTLADELDGECEANPCLSATLKLNTDWQRALQR